jgi:hypothetical protein
LKIIAASLGAAEVAVVMAGFSNILPSAPFADDIRRLVAGFKSAFPDEVQAMLGKLSLCRIPQQLSSDPKQLWLQLCITRNLKANGIRRRGQRPCRSGCRCPGDAVTKYHNPPLCQCQFRMALGAKKQNNRMYYLCPCCQCPGKRKLQDILDHAWRMHSFLPGCNHDFQLFQASGSMDSNMAVVQVPYVGPRDLPAWEAQWHQHNIDSRTRCILRELVPAWEAQWHSDNTDERIRSWVINNVTSKLTPKTVKLITEESESDSDYV